MTQQEKQIKRQVNLLNFAERLANVSRGCAHVGCVGGTFYGLRETLENSNEIGLQNLSPQPANLHHRVSASVEPAVEALAA